MYKKIIYYFIKYLLYIVTLTALTGFLAKTNNMPGAVPREHVKTIIEYTDKFLIKINVIKDAKIIQKYYGKKQGTEIKSLTSQTRYEANIFSALLNLVLKNGYDLRNMAELNSVAAALNGFVERQYEKYKGIAESSYVTRFVQENSVGLKNNNSAGLIQNILMPFTEVKQMVILNSKQQELLNIQSDSTLSLDRSSIIKLFSAAEQVPIALARSDDQRKCFVFLFKKTEGYIYFIVSADFFKVYFDEQAMKNKVFIFDDQYSILHSNIEDENFRIKTEANLASPKLEYDKTVYKREFIRLEKINLYSGILYPDYAALAVVLNLVKWICILAALYFLIMNFKFLWNKIRILKAKRPSQLEMVTGAMLEVAKSIKSATGSMPAVTASAVQINPDTIEKIVENVVEKIGFENKEQPVRIREVRHKEITEWKIIEP